MKITKYGEWNIKVMMGYNDMIRGSRFLHHLQALYRKQKQQKKALRELDKAVKKRNERIEELEDHIEYLEERIDDLDGWIEENL